MKVNPYQFDGVYEINFAPVVDERGYFVRTYDRTTLEKYGLHCEWVQENHSLSIRKGTVRGLHFQFAPYTESKLIRVIRGRIFDVFVDLRNGSPTFGQWSGIELSESTPSAVYISKGFAHGFCSLTDNCEVTYKVDKPYSPSHEGGILWRDESLRINWPQSNVILSERDSSLLSLEEFIEQYRALDVM